MRGLGSAARPHAAVAPRATSAVERAFGMKQTRGDAPAARSVTGREASPSSARRVGSDAVPRRAAPVHDASTVGERAIRKRRQSVTPGSEMARDRKRIKVTQGATNVEMVVFAAAIKMPAKNAQDTLQKRLAAELDALRDLVKKAEALSRGNKQFVAVEPRMEQAAPSPKGTKTSSPLVEEVDAPRTSPAEVKIEIVDPEEEIDICGGVSPVVVIRDTSPLFPVKSPALAVFPPNENATPEPSRLPEPASETVQNVTTSPAPSAVLPKKTDSRARAPKPVPVIAKKVQGSQPISVLLARAKEAYEIRQQKGNGWEREKVRREVRQMEKAVLPDETIHPEDLKELRIMEFGYVLHQLGVFLRPDV